MQSDQNNHLTINNCPHCIPENIWRINQLAENMPEPECPCDICDEQGDILVCLKPDCGRISCSHKTNSHMANVHQAMNANHSHPIAFQFSDQKFWCYACNSYIEHPMLEVIKRFYQIRTQNDGLSEADTF